jgi:hypothetical protein
VVALFDIVPERVGDERRQSTLGPVAAVKRRVVLALPVLGVSPLQLVSKG